MEIIMEDQLSIYRVEISGWDVHEQFFVERAALQWGQGEQRTALIRRRVRPGALVFVRLLQDTAPACSFPVAYRARQIREREGDELYELSLTQVWPAEQHSSPGGTALFDAARDRALGMN
jgi:hypothetical protein